MALISTRTRVIKIAGWFCVVLSLQCAYECSVGDADIRFVEEGSRILDKKRRYGIPPCIRRICFLCEKKKNSRNIV